MSSYFKSIAFYGVAICLVLLLFSIVTSYGEANLKAPTAIDGRYHFSYSPKRNCSSPNPLVLTIGQSGIYLNGFFSVDADAAHQVKASEQQSSLTGQLNNQQLNLTGTVLNSTLCNNLVSQAHATSHVIIQSQIEGANLQGQITLSGIPGRIDFTAQKEAAQPSEESISH